MHFTIQQCLSFFRLTPTRRRTALERMSAHASARKDCAPLMGPIVKAIAVQEKAMMVAARWRKAEGDQALHGEGARELDAAVDRALNGLFVTLENIVRSFGPAEGEVAKKLLAELFPGGAGPIVHLTYAEEHGAILTILHRLQTDLADDVKTLDLESWVQRLEVVNDDYGKVLTRPERLTWDDVVAADTAGYAAFSGVIARVLGLFPDNEPAEVAARAELLTPVVDQQEELAKIRARRKLAAGTTEGVDPVQEAQQDLLDDAQDPEAEAAPEAPPATPAPEPPTEAPTAEPVAI